MTFFWSVLLLPSSPWNLLPSCHPRIYYPIIFPLPTSPNPKGRLHNMFNLRLYNKVVLLTSTVNLMNLLGSSYFQFGWRHGYRKGQSLFSNNITTDSRDKISAFSLRICQHSSQLRTSFCVLLWLFPGSFFSPRSV